MRPRSKGIKGIKGFKWLKWVKRTLVVLVILAVGLPLGVVALLHNDAVFNAIAQKGLGSFNPTIAGSVSVERIGLDLNKIHMRGLRVHPASRGLTRPNPTPFWVPLAWCCGSAQRQRSGARSNFENCI